MLNPTTIDPIPAFPSPIHSRTVCFHVETPSGLEVRFVEVTRTGILIEGQSKYPPELSAPESGTIPESEWNATRLEAIRQGSKFFGLDRAAN